MNTKISIENLPEKLNETDKKAILRLDNYLSEQCNLKATFYMYSYDVRNFDHVYRLQLLNKNKMFQIKELTFFKLKKQKLVAEDHLWSFLSSKLRICYSRSGLTIYQLFTQWSGDFLEEHTVNIIEHEAFTQVCPFELVPILSAKEHLT